VKGGEEPTTFTLPETNSQFSPAKWRVGRHFLKIGPANFEMAISILSQFFLLAEQNLAMAENLACWPFVEKIWSWSFVISKS